MIKKILIFCLLLSKFLSADDFINISLNDYIGIIAKQKNITILIDKNIDKKFSLMISTNIKKETYFDILETLLNNNDLKLVFKKNHFFITPKFNDVLVMNRYKFNYIDKEDIESIMSLTPYKFKFINSLKTIFVYCDNKAFLDLQETFKSVDLFPLQRKLKFTILDTDLNKIKDYSVDTSLNLGGNKNLFFNLVAYPFQATNILDSTTSPGLSSFINFLYSNGLTDIVSTPTIPIFDDKKSVFEVVKNIPFKIGTTSTTNTTTTTTTNINYKDVGLKIEIFPTITKDLTYLDIDLTLENILSVTIDNLPTVSKRHIHQFISLKKGELFVLTGLNQKETYKDYTSVPYLSKIPFLEWLFKNEYEKTVHTNLSILIQVD